MTLPRSTGAAWALRPYWAAWRISQATFAALISALLGTQPVYRQSPPGRYASISATFAPSWAANGAADSPAEPAPMTIRSYSSAIEISSLRRWDPGLQPPGSLAAIRYYCDRAETEELRRGSAERLEAVRGAG